MPLPHPPTPRFSLSGLSHTRISAYDQPEVQKPLEDYLYDIPVLPQVSTDPKWTRRRRLALSKEQAKSNSVTEEKVTFSRRGPLWDADEEDNYELRELLNSAETRKRRLIRLPLHDLPLSFSRCSSCGSALSSGSSSSGGSVFSSPTSSGYSSPTLSPSSSPPKRPSSLRSWLFTPPPPSSSAEEDCRCAAVPVPTSRLTRVGVEVSETPLHVNLRSAMPHSRTSHPESLPERPTAHPRGPSAFEQILGYAKSLQEAYVRVAVSSYDISPSYIADDSESSDEDDTDEDQGNQKPAPSATRQALRKQGYRAAATTVQFLFQSRIGDAEEDDGECLTFSLGPRPFPASAFHPSDDVEGPSLSTPAEVSRGRSRSRASITQRLAAQSIPALASGALKYTSPSPHPTSSAPAQQDTLNARLRIIPNPVYLRLLAVRHTLSQSHSSSSMSLKSSSSMLVTDEGLRFPLLSAGIELSKMCTGREKLVGWGFNSALVPIDESKQRRRSSLCISFSC